MLEPRRLAARAAARRIAALLGEDVGRTAGYRTRLDRAISSATRIEIVTEGILTRRLQSDPALEGVGLVIFDEFHERHLQTDLALVLALDVQETIRPDLRLLLMSATLEGQPIERILPGAPRIVAEGRQHPVSIEYLAREPERSTAETVARAVLGILPRTSGDILAFLPGGGEIARAATALAESTHDLDIALLPLYGDLPREEQDRALGPDARGRRKVILATPVAESSLTIDSVRAVVDSGLARAPRFDPASGMTRLETVRIARANADQRAGRAGRQAPGIAVRLWTEATHFGLAERARPEIELVDLAPLALELAAWGSSDPRSMRWPDPPPQGAWERARSFLEECGAVDPGGKITPLGRELAAIPLHPRLALMVRAARPLGLVGLACDLAAILDERDLLRAQGPRSELDPDIRLRLDALNAWRISKRPGPDADPGACRIVDRIASDLRRRLDAGAPPRAATFDRAGELLAHAYPDRVARRRAEGGGWLLANGRGADLGFRPTSSGAAGPSSSVPNTAREGAGDEDLLVAARIDGRSRVARIQLAAPLRREALEQALPGKIGKLASCRWSSIDRAVVASEEIRYGAIVLASRQVPTLPADRDTAFLAGVREMGLASLPWTDEARAFRERVAAVRAWSVDPGGPCVGPDLADEALRERLEEWLAPWVTGMTRAADLARLDLAAILQGLLPGNERRILDNLAPTHLEVPSGSRIRIAYERGRPPVLAVKLQELFGLAATPTVYGGKVPVLLHLLSPARRPIQVTQDLVSFWKNTYPQVRKELFARYPRHPWPEDPWTAPPTRRAKPR